MMSDIGSIEEIARVLRNHLRTVEKEKRSRQPVGKAEVTRRAYLLLEHCSRANIPPPRALLDLMADLLLGKKDAKSGKAKLAEPWRIAIEHEAEALFQAMRVERQNGVKPDEKNVPLPYVASERSVAFAAFPNKDARKTIREWRKDIDYLMTVVDEAMTRLNREIGRSSLPKNYKPYVSYVYFLRGLPRSACERVLGSGVSIVEDGPNLNLIAPMADQ